MTAAEVKRRTPGYHYTSVAAVLGLVAIAIAIDGTRLAAGGGRAMAAINTAGTVALVGGLIVMYVMRLAFVPSLSSGQRTAVTRLAQAIFMIELLAAVAGSFFVFASPAATSATRSFMIGGDLLQVGTLMWIFRYANG